MPYLDHAGAALPSAQQMQEVALFLQAQRLSNPHSHHSTSTVTKQIVDNARERIRAHFHAHDYSVIFTSNTTHSLRLVAETFAFPAKLDTSFEMTDSLMTGTASSPSLAYLADSHHSVVGMRELARSRVDYVSCLKQLPREIPYNEGSLFVLTAMSNFCGFKYDLKVVGELQDKGWSVCLDAAGWVSSSPLDLSLLRPDFAVFSFYKLFGYPTGVGALLVRNDRADRLHKTYFGGGSKGFDDLERYGGIRSIQKHSFSIAQAAFDMLNHKFHWNGKPSTVLYRRGTKMEDQGPVVSFNLRREDGSFVGYAEVSKMADLFGLDIRTGCFCNIGACQAYLDLSDEDILANIETGKRCGDELDILNGRPTGAVRVSFGRQSSLEDVAALEQMIDYCFMGQRAAPATVPPLKLTDYRPQLSKLFCYPVKSCRGLEVTSAHLKPTGLQYDRHFMIVSNEIILSQKKYPQLSRIGTRLTNKALELISDGVDPIGVALSPPEVNGVGKIVCTNSVATVDCGKEVGNWLSKVLEIPNCRLQAVTEESDRSLSNQAPYLLVNEASAQLMATQIGLTLEDVISRFRPNLVVKGIPAFIEDTMTRFRIEGAEFEVTEKCTRCEMICVNQVTGEKDPRLIVALRDLRDRQRMTFGVYVRQLSYHETSISTGDVIDFHE